MVIWYFSDDFILKSDDIIEYENGRLVFVFDSVKKYILSFYNYLIKKVVFVLDLLDFMFDVWGILDFVGVVLSFEVG